MYKLWRLMGRSRRNRGTTVVGAGGTIAYWHRDRFAIIWTNPRRSPFSWTPWTGIATYNWVLQWWTLSFLSSILRLSRVQPRNDITCCTLLLLPLEPIMIIDQTAQCRHEMSYATLEVDKLLYEPFHCTSTSKVAIVEAPFTASDSNMVTAAKLDLNRRRWGIEPC